MTKFRDFWDLEIPEVLLELGFIDCSWKNDAAARMEHPWPDVYGNVLEVWVGNENTTHELGEGNRYMVGYVNPDHDENGRVGEPEELGLSFQTDDLRSLIQFVLAMIDAQNMEWHQKRLKEGVIS